MQVITISIYIILPSKKMGNINVYGWVEKIRHGKRDLITEVNENHPLRILNHKLINPLFEDESAFCVASAMACQIYQK